MSHLQFVSKPNTWLACALVVALGVRLLGIDFGLPLRLHPDEPSLVLNAKHMLTGDLNPHFFRYSSLYIYQLFTLDSVAQLLGNIFARVPTSSFLWLLARLLTAIYGTLSIWAVYILGATIVSDWTGVAAAWLMALNPEHIRQSHYATVDVPMIFWVILSLGFAVRAMRGQRSLWLAAGVTLGLAVGTKYSALLFVAIVGLFLLITLYRDTSQTRSDRIQANSPWILIGLGTILGLGVIFLPLDMVLQLGKQWSTDGTLKREYLSLLNSVLWLWGATAAAAIAVGILAFFRPSFHRITNSLVHPIMITFVCLVAGTFILTSPYVLLDLPIATRDILYEYRHMLIGAAAQVSSTDPIRATLQVDALPQQSFYYADWWLAQNGWLMTGFALVGAVLLMRRAPLPNLLFVVGIVMLGLTITRAATKADRYALPMVPIIAVWVGATLTWFFRANKSAILRGAVTAAVLTTPALASWSILHRDFVLPNTNMLAYRWLLNAAPPGALIVREDATPDIEDATEAYRVITTQSAFEAKTLEEWQKTRVNYFVVGKLRDSFYRFNATLYPRIVENYAALDETAILQAEFLPSANVAGSPVWIYRLP